MLKKSWTVVDKPYKGETMQQQYQFEPQAASGIQVSSVGSYDGDIPYGNQYSQVGELVDMWANLFEQQGDKAGAFWEAYGIIMSSREMPGVERRIDRLSATGFKAPTRRMEFVKRNPVTVVVYFATQGKDLYVSWRAFVQGSLSLLRIVMWLILCAVVAFPFGSKTMRQYDSFGNTWESTRFEAGPWLGVAIGVALVTAILIALYGMIYRRGDALALLRTALNELQVDDVAALSSAVHYSLVQAADKVGIDTTKLEPREPFYNHRRKARI